MSHLSLAKQIESDAIDTVEDTMTGNKLSPYERAEQKLNAVKIGAIVMAVIIYAGLSAELGLALGSLIAGGLAALLVPVAIYLQRNRARLEEKFMRRLLKIPEPVLNEVFETDLRVFPTARGLQLYSKTNFPRFSDQKFVRVIFDDVPNGILYEVKSHYFEEKQCAEALDLQVPDSEPLAKAWDKKLRNKLHKNPDMAIEIAYDPKALN
ncbi:MAG: hypothetical protein P1P90_00200 [Patescibacteria group bacterium]|nr:hypothetical protein [Patescibacteria group bacterium]